MAGFFAPMIHQDIDGSWADYITRVTYDGDWHGLDNWNNLFAYPLQAFVYVSVIDDPWRWYLTYGVFHPRDWCDLLSGDFCILSADAHENDWEGLRVVVDKRMSTGAWPYGQVIAAQTVGHGEYKAYRNCNLEGGHLNYVRSAYQMTVFGGFALPCLSRVPGGNTQPQPPVRVAVHVQPRGHGIRSLQDGDYPFPGGDRIVYSPNRFVAGVPGAPVGTQEIDYQLVWQHLPELAGLSLWDTRHGAQGSPFADLDVIGPHLVPYRYNFAGDDGMNDRANAAWGQDQDALDATARGDWHNHPAWAWRHHFAPDPDVPGSVELFGPLVQPRAHSCYLNDIYWSDQPVPGSGGGGVGGGECTDPTCLTPRIAVPDARRGRLVRELRWDFESPGGFASTLEDAARAEVGEVPDDGWGYQRGRAGVVTLTGRGHATLRLPVPDSVDFGAYRMLVMRIRFPDGRTDAVPRVRLRARSGEVVATATPRVQRTAAAGWAILQLDLPPLDAAGPGEGIGGVELDLPPLAAADQVQVDYVVVAQ